MAIRVFIGLGGNEGDRGGILRAAAVDVGRLPGTRVVARSSLYEARPLGPSERPFFNAAIELDTELALEPLRHHLVAIECAHGRPPVEARTRWAARPLDLDLLLAFDEAPLTVQTPTLTVPHPELAHRDFVLLPLLDLDPTLTLHGTSLPDLAESLRPEQRTILRRFDDWDPPA